MSVCCLSCHGVNTARLKWLNSLFLPSFYGSKRLFWSKHWKLSSCRNIINHYFPPVCQEKNLLIPKHFFSSTMSTSYHLGLKWFWSSRTECQHPDAQYHIIILINQCIHTVEIPECILNKSARKEQRRVIIYTFFPSLILWHIPRDGKQGKKRAISSTWERKRTCSSIIEALGKNKREEAMHPLCLLWGVRY